MQVVRIPGKDVSYPNICACCTAPASTTMQIRKEDLKALATAAVLAAGGASGAGLWRESRAVKVPYCAECSKHVRWRRSGGWLGVVLHVPVNGFFALLLGFVIAVTASAAGLFGGDGDFDHPNWFIVWGFVSVGVAMALWTIRLRPKGPLGRNHAREKMAVEIARFTKNEIALRCHNEAFAAKLIEANPGSVPSRMG